jgi:glycosyltransferase involved in cell wall biosynthesis
MVFLQIVSSMGVKSGGTSSCLYAILKEFQIQKIDANVLCFEVKKDDKLIGEDSFIKKIPLHKNNKFKYSRDFKNSLESIQNISLYHVNGLWEYPSIIAPKIARKKGSPYIISPHGMLYPQALKKNKWIKKLIYFLYLKKDLQRADVIHVTCIDEMQYIRDIGITTPIAIIPNAIEANELLKKQIKSNCKMKFGYLGRVHPRKKIETLLYVWAKLGKKVKDAELVIIGSGEVSYMDFLQKETKRLQLDNVIFTGFLAGVEKEEMLESLSYLAVPSDFENFGMIVVEALALGIPVIASKGTPWIELETNNCGWWITNDTSTFYETFKKALQLSETERLIMGENGKKLVLEKYDSKNVAQKMMKLYKWVMENGETPDFIYFSSYVLTLINFFFI